MSLVVVKEQVLPICTDMWVQVEDSSPNPSSQSKFQVPIKDLSTSQRFKYQSKLRIQVEDSYRSCNRAVRELHILQLKHTLICTHAKKHKLQLTQQKGEEPNLAEMIEI